MTEGIIIALVTGGLALAGVLVKMFVQFRGDDLSSHDELHSAVTALKQENAEQHAQVAADVKDVSAKLDRHIERFDVADRDNRRVHEELIRGLGRVEGRLKSDD